MNVFGRFEIRKPQTTGNPTYPVLPEIAYAYEQGARTRKSPEFLIPD